jgi:hypothetical protein
MQDTQLPTFADLNIPAPILKALKDVGYETPSPIQAATIPLLMEGRDVLGQAQTGTGKTAAFALPVLSRIDVKSRAAGAGAGADARAGDPGRRSLPELRRPPEELPRAADLRRPEPTARSCRRCAAACTSWSAPRAA